LTTALNCVSFVQEEDPNYGPWSKTSDLRPFSGVGYYTSLSNFCNGIAFQCCCLVGNWFLLYSKRSCHILYFSIVKRSLKDMAWSFEFNISFRFVRFVYVYFSLAGYYLVSSGRWLPTFRRNTLYHLQASISKKGLTYSPETIVIQNDCRAGCCNRYGRCVNPPFCLRQSSFRTSVFFSFIPFVPASLRFSPPLPARFYFFSPLFSPPLFLFLKSCVDIALSLLY
jgi:hypothetical protein